MGSKSTSQLPLAVGTDNSDVFYMVRYVGGEPNDFKVKRADVHEAVLSLQRTISNAELLALFDTPVELLAGIPGKSIVPKVVLISPINGSGGWDTEQTIVIGVRISDIEGFAQFDMAELVAKNVLYASASLIQNAPLGEALSIAAIGENPTGGDTDLLVQVFYSLY